MREAKRIPVDNLLGKTIADREKPSISFYVDSKLEKELSDILKDSSFLKKFRRVVAAILGGIYTNDIYGKESFSDETKDIWAIKITVRENNYRIYCKEFFNDHGKNIVMTHLLKKKCQKNDKRIRTILEKIGGYNYEWINNE